MQANIYYARHIYIVNIYIITFILIFDNKRKLYYTLFWKQNKFKSIIKSIIKKRLYQ